jgi:hypothetical protein
MLTFGDSVFLFFVLFRFTHFAQCIVSLKVVRLRCLDMYTSVELRTNTDKIVLVPSYVSCFDSLSTEKHKNEGVDL